MFNEVKCPACGETQKGLQLSGEQRVWLDSLKDTILEHMKFLETLPEEAQNTPDVQGWYAISEAYLFLYGYMRSREDTRDDKVN